MAFGQKKMEDGMARPAAPSMPAPARVPEHAHNCNPIMCGKSFGSKILYTLIGVFLVYLIFYLGTLMRLNMKQFFYVGQADQMERTITVNGYGKMNGINNIAVTTIGYNNTDKDVSKAQADNKKVMDQVYADLKKMNIEDKDLESNYTIYPQYDYTQANGQQFKGYQVSNNVTVKIRDLAKVPDVLALAGKYGANSVNGLSFTMDDTQELKNQARTKALSDAKAKAFKLAQNLGVQLVEVVSYNEYEGSTGGPYPVMNNYGMGAGADVKAAPTVSGGSQDVEMNVNITYKIVSKSAW